jgi:hypothetical protein
VRFGIVVQVFSIDQCGSARQMAAAVEMSANDETWGSGMREAASYTNGRLPSGVLVSDLPGCVLAAYIRWILDHGKKQAKHHQNRERRCDHHVNTLTSTYRPSN